MNYNLSDIGALFNVHCPEQKIINGVSIDSRKIKAGNLFVALKGERFDGHQFINEVQEKGAAAVLCQYKSESCSIPQLIVEDTLQALTDLAKFHRKKCNLQIIALTGSNGKTTVKEMIACILPKPSHATPGNLNNHIGVPLSILQLTSEHRYAVFELGANHKGEIAHTVDLVQPNVTLINNIGPAHIEGFGSIDGVARAKGEIHQGLQSGGVAVVNEDDSYAHFWDNILQNKQKLGFSVSKNTAIHAEQLTFDEKGRGHFILVTPKSRVLIQLKVPGQHNVSNALAAAACTFALNISLEEIAVGLSNFKGVKGRMTFLEGKNQALVIDDTYNANLKSTLAALEVLSQYQGDKIFVFGDMGELGTWSEQHHRDIGQAAKAMGINKLLTCGKLSEYASQAYGPESKHYQQQHDLVKIYWFV